MDFNFDGIPDDPTKIQDGNGTRPKPGRGMVLITGWNEYGGAKGKAHELEFEIVAWTNKDDIGKQHSENIFHADTTGKGFPMKRLTTLAMAAGLLRPSLIKEAKAKRLTVELDMKNLVGRPIMLELVEEPDKDKPEKTYIRVGNIGLGMYHCKDKRVAEWPKNAQLLAANSALIGEWETETAPSTGTQPPAKRPEPPADPFASMG